jgi:hypothetical protein
VFNSAEIQTHSNGPVPVCGRHWIVTRAAGDRHVCTRETFEITCKAPCKAPVETGQRPWAMDTPAAVSIGEK